VCNLASIALATYVKNGDDGPYFDFKDLETVVRIVTRNLNRVIDINFYPTNETRTSNNSERPMGIGVQGLANCFIQMGYPFDSPEARKLNKEIFEMIYYASVSESCEIAKKEGPYSSFKGSPLSEGKFQFDLWIEDGHDVELSGALKLDWNGLRENVKRFGVRNSLQIALMPTASTSQLLGFNEAFEPFTSNMYTRRTLAGSYKIVNKQLIHDLIDAKLWSTNMKDKILYYDGCIQEIEEIPEKIRSLYKTSWDLSQKHIIDMCVDRAPFVDQTQSMNIHLAGPTRGQMSSLHMYAWSKGLKTGMYYLRTKPSKKAIQVTLDPKFSKKMQESKKIKQDTKLVVQPKKIEPLDDVDDMSGWVCTKEDGCVSCGS
jgi:ribonucleoside-diphosphate reductase alpha subunit